MASSRPLKIDRRVLKAAAQFVSTDPKEPRSFLRRVLLDCFSIPGRATIVAGNGSLLGIFDVGEIGPGISSALLSPAAIRAIPTLKKDNTLQAVTVDGACLSYLDDDGNLTRSDLMTRQDIGGPLFGPWAKLVVEPPSGEIAFFNPEHLTPFTKARKMLGLPDQYWLQIRHNGNNPAPVTWPDYPGFVGLINPVSTDIGTIPDWLTQKLNCHTGKGLSVIGDHQPSPESSS